MSIEGHIPNKIETEETHEGLSASDSLRGTMALSIIGGIMLATAANAGESIEDCSTQNFSSALDSYSSTLKETQGNIKETSVTQKIAQDVVDAVGYNALGSADAVKEEMRANKEVDKAYSVHYTHVERLIEVTDTCRQQVDDLFHRLDDAKISKGPETPEQLQEMYKQASDSLKVLEDLVAKARK